MRLSPLLCSPFSKIPPCGQWVSGNNVVTQEACHSLSTIRIPSLSHLHSLDQKQDERLHYIPAPGAPLLKPRALPNIENDSFSSSDSLPRFMSDVFSIGVTTRLPAKRKLDTMDGWDHSVDNPSLRMHKHTLKKQWRQRARSHCLRR
ncbi:hypothetical protein SERLADRAFT_401674 [Serpula lacrymans var. lacrymans S7.9]|uniref:Uncharacterized protein n=1 Tax=Serpula lacrymans var. lacrymans (strain S7.9) TaxID=578457 RepID=F8PAX8_SERL9|nr:uncharacterized protein SERLADRAFT_401674 [Serpula lacrymans var. lacrymans S7.9]EGO19419.1 hypothetical protein SERLADRAFT_401674 [Serpula lacrymans var. lacrymans S7.9]